MGAWKDWEIGMIEGGATRAEIIAAEARLKALLDAFPGAELLDESEVA